MSAWCVFKSPLGPSIIVSRTSAAVRPISAPWKDSPWRVASSCTHSAADLVLPQPRPVRMNHVLKRRIAAARIRSPRAGDHGESCGSRARRYQWSLSRLSVDGLTFDHLTHLEEFRAHTVGAVETEPAETPSNPSDRHVGRLDPSIDLDPQVLTR